MPLQPGEVLGHFEILAAIDAGDMGEVYKARDWRLDRTVGDLRGIVKVAETGGTPELVIERDRTRGESPTAYPKLLPDGHRFLYMANYGGDEGRTIYIGDIEEKSSRDRRRVFDSTAMGQVVNGLDGQTRRGFTGTSICHLAASTRWSRFRRA